MGIEATIKFWVNEESDKSKKAIIEEAFEKLKQHAANLDSIQLTKSVLTLNQKPGTLEIYKRSLNVTWYTLYVNRAYLAVVFGGILNELQNKSKEMKLNRSDIGFID
jgi:hypothetical protein